MVKKKWAIFDEPDSNGGKHGKLKPRTSSLRIVILWYNSLPESQCDGNFDLLQIFQQITGLLWIELCCDC